MTNERRELASHDEFVKSIARLYRREELRRHGSLRTILVYPRVSVGQLSEIPAQRKRLREFRISKPKKIGDSFYKISIALRRRSETLYVDTRLEDLWLVHIVSSENLASSLTHRFAKLSYPFLALAHMRSSELVGILDRLEEKYGIRPMITRLVARQFFETKQESATYRRRTLVLYQENSEPALRVLQDAFPIFPEILTVQVQDREGTLYTAAISRRGYVRLFGGPRVMHFFDDLMEFIAVPAARGLEMFKDREPKAINGVFSSRPLQIRVGANLSTGLPPLRDALLKSYHCVIYHSGNPYLDLAVVDAPSASEFRVIASGDSVVVVPSKYRSPSSLMRLTRTIMETIGGEREEEFEQSAAAE